MQAEDTVLCLKCNSNVLRKCEMIHSRVCKPKQVQKQKRGIFSNVFFFGDQKNQKEEDQDKIPCTQCGQSFPFSVFAFHQEECVGHQLTKCNQCNILFPTFLFEQHLQVCLGPKQKLPQQVQPKNIKQKEPSIKEDPQIDNILDIMIRELATKQINNQKLTDVPLTAKQLQKLQLFKLKAEEECSICCCMINIEIKEIKLNCNHIFHKRCITSWLSKNPFCPMCRQHALKR